MLRSFAVLLLLATALAAPAAESRKQPITIEALAAHEPSTPASITWSPDGSHIAYTHQSKVWLFEARGGKRRELVALSELEKRAVPLAAPREFSWENRRVREQPLQWFPAGDRLLVLAAGDLFIVNAANGRWQQVTETPTAERDPKLSPDGKRVAYRRGNDLYSLDLVSREEQALTTDGSDKLWNARPDWVYPEELDLGSAYWWSPDSQRIAYLQFDMGRQPLYPMVDYSVSPPVYEPQYFPQAGEPNADVRVGIVSAAGKPTEWLDFGDTRDRLIARVAWTPDSSGVAVQRLNRVQNRLDLLLAEAGTGKVRTLLTEESPYWVNVGNEFRFLEDGRFLWASERTGYRHLFLYSPDGRELAQLTGGEWMVTEVGGVDEKAGLVYYLSTEASPLERRLYAAPLAGGPARPVTQEAGSHSVQMNPQATAFLNTFSSLAEPARIAVFDANGRQTELFHGPDPYLKKFEILKPEVVEVRASDGALLYGRVLKPANFEPDRKYPAIVSVYGGPHAQSVKNAFDCFCLDQVFAQQGFVVWQLDNRGTAGRGLQWESAVYRRLGERELQDQQEGIRHLVSLGYVDEGRIGMHGWSYGGFMTLYSLLHAPDLLRAGIAGAPVTDWRLYDTIYTERYLGLPSENTEGYHQSSPLNFAPNLKAPLMLIHNLQDDNVHFQNTVKMADELIAAGKGFDLKVFSAKTHGLSGANRRGMQEAMLAFFQRHLQD